MSNWNLVNELIELKDDPKKGIYFIKNQVEKARFESYGEILKSAKRFATLYLEKGVRKGDRVALMLPNGPEFLYSFLGAMLIGAIPVALYPPLRLGNLKEWEDRTVGLLKSVRPHALVTEKNIASLAVKAITATSSKMVLLDPSYALNYKEIERVHIPEKHEVAFIQFSSGTTGSPKPLAVTHENIDHNTSSILRSFVFKKENNTCVSWLPLYHDMGLVGCLMCPIRKKANIVLIRSEQFLANPYLWPKAITHFKGNFTVAPNFAFGLLNNKINDEKLNTLDLSSLEVILCGAETVVPKVMNKFLQKYSAVGLNKNVLMPVYGMSETTLAVTFSKQGRGPEFYQFDKDALLLNGIIKKSNDGITLTSVGAPINGIEVKILGADNKILNEEGKLGEVLVKGKSITPGLFGADSKIIPHQTVQGFLKTGDQGFIYDNKLFLWGRLKDVVIINGKNFDAHIIEQVLDQIQGVRKGCTIAFGNYNESSQTEELVVLIELEKGTKENPLDLKESVRAQILDKIHINTSHIQFYSPGTLPRTSSGKLKRSEAKKLWFQNKLKNYKEIGKWELIKRLVTGRSELKKWQNEF